MVSLEYQPLLRAAWCGGVASCSVSSQYVLRLFLKCLCCLQVMGACVVRVGFRLGRCKVVRLLLNGGLGYVGGGGIRSGSVIL